MDARKPSALLNAVVVLLLALAAGSCLTLWAQETVTNLYGPYLGQDPPGMEPQIFVPEDLRSNSEWWWHGAPAFSPDGREFFLDVYFAHQGIRVRFMEMNPSDDLWTSPQAPGFADSSDTASPSFTPDGGRVFFISDRPGGFVWVSTRTANGWSAPEPVEFPVPASLGYGWRVSVARDETLYMQMTDSASDTGFDIYRIRKVDGTYLQPERLDDNVNSPNADLGAFIDPEGRFLVFQSDRPGGYGSSDLYISYRGLDGSWDPAINLGEPVNSISGEGSPFVSPDGRYFFFISDRVHQYDRNPYWVDSRVVFRHSNPLPRRPSARRRPTDGGP